jgi:hypothetical protein
VLSVRGDESVASRRSFHRHRRCRLATDAGGVVNCSFTIEAVARAGRSAGGLHALNQGRGVPTKPAGPDLALVARDRDRPLTGERAAIRRALRCGQTRIGVMCHHPWGVLRCLRHRSLVPAKMSLARLINSNSLVSSAAVRPNGSRRRRLRCSWR